MHHRLFLSLITVFLLVLSSCTPKATQPSANNSPTSTPTQILLAMTPTSTPEASITPTDEPPELCDIDYLPNYICKFDNNAPLIRLFVHYFKELDFYRMDSHMAAWRIHNLEGNR